MNMFQPPGVGHPFDISGSPFTHCILNANEGIALRRICFLLKSGAAQQARRLHEVTCRKSQIFSVSLAQLLGTISQQMPCRSSRRQTWQICQQRTQVGARLGQFHGGALPDALQAVIARFGKRLPVGNARAFR